MYVLMRVRMYMYYVCMYVCVHACMHVCVYVFEMKQQSVAHECEFSDKHNFISLWHYTDYTRPVKLKTSSGPKQIFNWTSCAAICTDIFARPQCRKTQRCKILIVFNIAEFLWCIVQDT